MDKTPRIPDASHPISVEPESRRIVIKSNGRVLVDTRRALRLKEASYPAVHYIPRSDVDMGQLERTDHLTYCPYKGDCHYFSIPAGGPKAVNAVWTYEQPYASVEMIKDHLSFYSDRVDSIELI
jgi:uncharacterized protein (DUF427 family)